MDINLNNLLVNKYEYLFDSLTITVNETPHKIEPVQLTNLYIERDYDVDYLPVVLMQLVIGDKLYYDICSNYTKTTFHLVMKMQISVDETTKTGGGIFLQQTFVPKGVDGTPFTSKKLYDMMEDSSTAGEGSMMTEFTNNRTFILAKQTDLDITKNISNLVLSSSTMTDAVGVLLTQAGVTQVLMSPMDNTTSYSELILLPQPLVAQLKYLNSFFGFYSEGSQIFFDLNMAYILRNSSGCTAYTKSEPKLVYMCIYDTSNAKTLQTGSIVYTGNRTAYVSLSSTQFSVEDLSNTSNDLMGSNSTIINDNGTVTQASSGNGTSSNVLSVRNHNPYYTSEVSMRMKELKCVVNVQLSDVELSLLTPNKEYKFLCSDTTTSSKLTGTFRLVSTKTIFVRSGDKYSTNMIVQFKRTNG